MPLPSKMGEKHDAALVAAEHHHSLYRWALALSRRDPQEASGIVQQTYLEIVEGRADLLAAKDPRAFLFGVAKKIASSRQRRRSIFGRIVFLAPPLQAEATQENPENAAALGEDVQRVRAALTKLPARQLQVVTLVFMEGLTIEKAAASMEVSVGSARTHYHRAKKRLATLLMEEKNA
jgi:RNA polymerase sigma factor (sigma-70 family)